MYVNPIVLIYPSSHVSFWLTISLFDKSLSVFWCGNMFIGRNLRITCINDIIGYLSYLCFKLIATLFIYLFIYLSIYLAVLGLGFVRGLSLVEASGGHSSLQCAGLSLSWPLPLRGTGSRCAGSAVVAHGPSCSVACGILPDQGSNPYPLH